MRIKLKAQITGTRNGLDWPKPGAVVDLPDDEAVSLCASGIATPVGEDRPEMATASEEGVEKRRSGLRKESMGG